jgi:hypothetical protein
MKEQIWQEDFYRPSSLKIEGFGDHSEILTHKYWYNDDHVMSTEWPIEDDI